MIPTDLQLSPDADTGNGMTVSEVRQRSSEVFAHATRFNRENFIKRSAERDAAVVADIEQQYAANLKRNADIDLVLTRAASTLATVAPLARKAVEAYETKGASEALRDGTVGEMAALLRFVLRDAAACEGLAKS